MPRSLGFTAVDANSLAVRLHDASAGVAVGLGLLRPEHARSSGRSRQALTILDEALANLKELEAAVRRERSRPVPADLVPALKRQAGLLGLAVELQVVGTMDDLAPYLVDFLDLVGREALMNVRRHSGARACQVDLDITAPEFVFRARDRGIGPGAHAEAGRGLSTLRDMARWLGCELTISSPPGFGTELVLTGPRHFIAAQKRAIEPSAEEVASS